MPGSDLSPADARILSILQREGRIPNQALAERVNMAASPCWRRVRQLEEQGVIEGYRAALSPAALGLGVFAFIRVRIDRHSEAEADEFASEVLKLEQVVACYSIAGDADFLLQVVAPDLDRYADFAMRVVRSLPRIKEMQTMFVLREIKPFSGLPLSPGLTKIQAQQAKENR